MSEPKASSEKKKRNGYISPSAVEFSEWTFCALAFFIPLYKPAAALAVAVWLLSALWAAAKYRLFRWPEMDLLNALPLSVAAFYLLHVIGMFWTENLAFGRFDLEVKASLLLFPLAFLFFFKVRQAMVPRIMIGFTLGIVLYIIICLIIGTYRGVTGEGWHNLTYSDLSRHQHPSYITWYTALALFWLLRASDVSLAFLKRWRWPIAVLFVLWLVTMSSKAGLVGGMGVLILVVLLSLKDRKFLLSKVTVGLIALFIVFFLTNPVSKVRVTEAFDEMAKRPEQINRETEQGSSTMRAMVWQSALELIRQRPLGVGTGDVKDELVKRYEIHGFKKPLEKKLNAHSQWLQSGVALGWPGMLILSLPFLLMALILYRKFTWLGAVFFGLTGFNFLVESMLEVQAGVIPFVFFMFFFLHRPGDEEPELV